MSTDTPSSPAVSWRDVTKVFPDGHAALSGVTLDVAPGEALALLGTSGSGKTTLLKTVNRLTDPTSGEVLVRGLPTHDWDPIALRRSIGYVIQDVGLLPHLSVLANVGIVPRIGGAPRSNWEPRAEELLRMVGLDPSTHGRRRPRELSGGQRQRVGVARALAADPDLVLMDEPFGALDPITRRELQEEFRALQRRLGKSVIVVTHDVREAFRLADRIALMDHGRLVQVGTPEEVVARPAGGFVRSFLEEAGVSEPNGPGANV
jgi:osmoprotectant transport system ATP-binding protein